MLNLNHFRLALGMAFKVHRNMVNGLKLKVRKFQGHVREDCEDYLFKEVRRKNLERRGWGGKVYARHPDLFLWKK